MLAVSSNKGLSASAAASIIGNNGDILIDLLYCLPVKSLCVFKVVSKQWLSLISDPYFESNYNLRSCRLSMPALFMKKILIDAGDVRESEFKTLVMDERNCVHFDIPIAVDLTSRIKLEHSCNGLVLCRVQDESTDFHTTYVIYNPSIRCCKTLPSPLFRNTYDPIILSVTVAFDPAKSPYYQVLAVCHTYTSESIYHIEIYSSKTDSWRDAGDSFTFSPPRVLSESGVYSNGSVHWIDQQTATLHYFDIDCELMKTIATPTQPFPEEDYNRHIVYFKECRGHIHLMEMRKDDTPRADIWEMQMDYSGWNVKYYVDLSPLTAVYPHIILERPQVFCRFGLDVLLIEEGEDSSRLILWIAEDKVISFDLKNKGFKEMYDVSPDVYVEGFQYIETLAHA